MSFRICNEGRSLRPFVSRYSMTMISACLVRLACVVAVEVRNRENEVRFPPPDDDDTFYTGHNGLCYSRLPTQHNLIEWSPPTRLWLLRCIYMHRTRMNVCPVLWHWRTNSTLSLWLVSTKATEFILCPVGFCYLRGRFPSCLVMCWVLLTIHDPMGFLEHTVE